MKTKWVRSLGIAMTMLIQVTAFSAETVREKLVTGLPFRPYGAVFFEGALFFSAEQNAAADCPAAHSYRVLSKPGADGKLAIEFLGEFACAQSYQSIGKRLFLTEGTKGADTHRVWEGGKWVDIAESTFKPVLLNRTAWMKYELHRQADRAKNPDFATAKVVTRTLVEGALGSQGLSLGLVLKTAAGKWFYAMLPLEEDSKGSRVLKALEGLPADWGTRPFRVVQNSKGKLLFYESETGEHSVARLAIWDATASAPAALVGDKTPSFKHPSFAQAIEEGFILTESGRSRLPGGTTRLSHVYLLNESGGFISELLKERDLSGVSVHENGYLISRGYSNEIALLGTLLRWTPNLSGYSVTASKELRVPAWPLAPKLKCAAHSYQQEDANTWSVFSQTPQGAIPLAYLTGVVSGACHEDSFALVSKSTCFVSTNLEIALLDEEKGVDGGTNSKDALKLTESTSPKVLKSENGILQIFKDASLVLVREPLSGTTFSRVRVRPQPPGFRVWLSDKGGPFNEYLNVVNTDGKEFSVEDTISQKFPDVDLGNFEMK